MWQTGYVRDVGRKKKVDELKSCGVRDGQQAVRRRKKQGQEEPGGEKGGRKPKMIRGEV